MRFEVLGPVRIRTRRREIAIAANRQRALLAMLLLQANRTVPAERLVDALWAEDPPRDARSQLHGCVYRLRKQLAAGGWTPCYASSVSRRLTSRSSSTTGSPGGAPSWPPAGSC